MQKFLFSVLVSILSVSAADANRYPIRQIDRPLVLPKKMWQESLNQSSFLYARGEAFYSEEAGYNGFFPGLPTYGITDNLEWVALPIPYFRYLLTHNTSSEDSVSKITNLSLALDGGITGFTYFNNKWHVFSNLGLQAKRPLGNHLWAMGHLGVACDNIDLLDLSSSLGLGFQWTDRFYSTTNYFLNLPNINSDFLTWSSQGISLNSGLNVTTHISLQLGFSLNSIEAELDFGPDLVWGQTASLTFQW